MKGLFITLFIVFFNSVNFTLCGVALGMAFSVPSSTGWVDWKAQCTTHWIGLYCTSSADENVCFTHSLFVKDKTMRGGNQWTQWDIICLIIQLGLCSKTKIIGTVLPIMSRKFFIGRREPNYRQQLELIKVISSQSLLVHLIKVD